MTRGSIQIRLLPIENSNIDGPGSGRCRPRWIGDEATETLDATARIGARPGQSPMMLKPPST